jgi:hypothetical protein
VATRLSITITCEITATDETPGTKVEETLEFAVSRLLTLQELADLTSTLLANAGNHAGRRDWAEGDDLLRAMADRVIEKKRKETR